MAKFQPGQSGNPSGRKAGTRLLAPALRKRLIENPEEFDELMDALIGLAKQGNPKAIETVRAAMDGPEIKQLDINQVTPETLLEFYQMMPDDGSETDESTD